MSGQHAGSRTDLATEPVRRASSDSAILRADPATHYVVRPSPTALDRGPLSPAALNAAVILLWLVSRTAGLPVGPEPWEAEAVGTADLLCSGLEVVLIALLVVSIRRPAAEESPSFTNVQRRLVVVGALAVAAVTVTALADTDPSRHGHHHSAHSALGYEIGDSRLVGGFGPSLHLDQVEGSFDEPGLGVGTTHGWVRIIEPTSPIRLG